MTIQVTSASKLAEAQKADEAKPEEAKSTPVAEAAEQSESTDSDTEEQEATEEDQDESDASDDSDDESEEAKATEKDDKPKRKSGSQRRKERAERAEAAAAVARAEADHWKSMALKDKGAGDTKADQPKAADTAGKPNPDTFETHAEYVEALTDWKLEQREKAREAEAQKSRMQTEQETLLKSHYDREKSFAEKTEDYAEIMEKVGYFKDASAVISSLIVESENGPELMYALAKDRDEYERINKLGPIAAAREIGKFEAKILARASEAKKPEPKKLTKAPKPLTPVGSAGATVTKSLSEMDYDEYKRTRQAQMKSRS